MAFKTASLLLWCAAHCAWAIDDGLARTPPMGLNSWTSVGSGVSAAFLQAMGDFFVSSGLREAGFEYICSDDGWSNGTRSAGGELQPDSKKFPAGLLGVANYLHSIQLKFGIYSAASSVVCSGRPGSLYNEFVDAATFAAAHVDYVKYDSCGEYSLGSRRFDVFADAVKATGAQMVISTEPFALWPNPLQASFSHLWRTGNDIDASWSTILDRSDRNAKWAAFAGPGSWNDPDMLQIGNGLTLAEERSHFGLWVISKAPLILGSDARKLSAAQLALLLNRDVIAVNQDALGVQARKLAVNGTLVPLFVGLASCYGASSLGSSPGFNGVTAASYRWNVTAQAAPINGTIVYSIGNSETGRCLGLRTYAGRSNVPLLVTCDPTDLTQAWSFPSGTRKIGALQSMAAVAAKSAATVLSVANSSVMGAIHGKDTVPLLDAAYGFQTLQLAPYAPEAPCHNRDCQDYDPHALWYFSPRNNVLSLAMAAASMYRCYEGPCYLLTSHLPAVDEYCLAHVASISNDGIDTEITRVPGVDVWGGPLSGGAYTFGLLNRGASPSPITANWAMLEVPSFSSGASACVRELFTNTSLGVHTTGVTVTVAPHDFALLRVVPGAAEC